MPNVVPNIQRHLAVVILAAGSSTRLGQAKQLLPYQGKTLLRYIVDIAVASKIDDIYAVTGYQQDQITQTLKDAQVSFIHNSEFNSGIASSIRSAVRELQEDYDGLLFITCDQLYLTSEILNELIAQYQSNPLHITCCQYEVGYGIPACFDKQYFEELLLLEGDVGAKKIIDTHMQGVQFVSFPLGHIDIDRISDLDYLI